MRFAGKSALVTGAASGIGRAAAELLAREGASLLILVGVAMDTVSQIEAQLVMRNYEGFLGAGSRLRGRRS